MKVNPYYPLKLLPPKKFVDSEREEAAEFVESLILGVSAKLNISQISNQFDGSYVGNVSKLSSDLYDESSTIYQTVSTTATNNEDLSVLSRIELESLVQNLRKDLKYYVNLSNTQHKQINTLKSENEIIKKSKSVSSKSFIFNAEAPRRDCNSSMFLKSEINSSNSLSPPKELTSKVISKDSVPYEDYEFWKSSDEKSEPDSNCFQDLAENKELWIVNAEKMLNTSKNSPDSTTKPGIKANALTRSPVLKYAAKDKLGHMTKKPSVLSNRNVGKSLSTSRQVHLMNQYGSFNPKLRAFH